MKTAICKTKIPQNRMAGSDLIAGPESRVSDTISEVQRHVDMVNGAICMMRDLSWGGNGSTPPDFEAIQNFLILMADHLDLVNDGLITVQKRITET